MLPLEIIGLGVLVVCAVPFVVPPRRTRTYEIPSAEIVKVVRK